MFSVLRFIDYASRTQLPDCSKLAKNWKNENDVTVCRLDVVVKFSLHCCVTFVKFSDCSKFHVNMVTSSGVITIFIYKGDWPDFWKSETPPSEFCSISGDLDRDEFHTNVKSYWMQQNARVTAFTVFSIWCVWLHAHMPAHMQLVWSLWKIACTKFVSESYVWDIGMKKMKER